MQKKKFDEDDGRTVADMSQVARPSFWGHLDASRSGERRPAVPIDAGRCPDLPFTTKEKWLITFAALKAALLIAFVFLGGLALVIAALFALWHLL